MQQIHLKPKKSGGSGGLLGTILGGVGGGILGAVASGGNPMGAMTGAGVGMGMGGAIGNVADPMRVKDRQPIQAMETATMVDPEVQVQQLQEATQLIDATPEIDPDEGSMLKEQFTQAIERLNRARQAQTMTKGGQKTWQV